MNATIVPDLIHCTKPRSLENKNSYPMISLIATITAKPDKTENLKTELLKLVELTTQEPGCILYILHQEVENPHVFRFYEQFRDQEAFDYHNNQPYIKNGESRAAFLDKPIELTFLSHLA
jgi:quinol monooxygenase YgiN